jgi:hypothetical protein
LAFDRVPKVHGNSPMATVPGTSALTVVELGRGYWRESRRPLASLAFVLPFLAVYETGVVFMGTGAVRNGADVWLRQILDQLGFSQYFLLPALTVSLLLAWHHLTRDRWRVSAAALYLMFAECAVWAWLLVGWGELQAILAQELGRHAWIGTTASTGTPWTVVGRAALVGRMLGFVGAGVYEEVLFRLLLLPPTLWTLARVGVRAGGQIAAAVLASSLLFAAAHYWGPRGETFDSFSFSFRVLAGAFFGLLFVQRGFGIAAGTHALYDIFVGIG